MKIIKNKKTNYHICYSKDASECVRYSSTELQKYLYKSTKVCVPLFSDKCAQRSKEIWIGNTRGVNYSYLLDSYSDEAFLIKNVDNNLLILGKTDRGTMYGVYYFLNKYINFRCLSNDTEIYINTDTIEVVDDEIKDFAFEHRDVYWNFAFDGNYASKNMLNSNLADLSVRKGGRRKWYNFHHSFADLLSPEENFDAHPEYFSLVDGKRKKEHTELCLSNEEVYKLVKAKLIKWIKDNPDCTVFSVAQDEWMGHFEKMACECENCKAIDDSHGSQSASIIKFVNRLEQDIKDEFPNVLLHTFAYQYSRKPPVNLIPNENVIVRLTNIECSWSKSIEEGALENPNGRNAKFLEDLTGWSKIAKRLYIWDYAVNYRNYLLPFPCLRSMYKNIMLYKRIGVKGVLMEGNFSFGGKGYLDELKAYLSSRLLTFDERSLEEIVKEFCDGYYGKASNKVQEYIYLFENNIKGDMWLYDDADHEMFTDELVSKAKEIIEEAMNLVSPNTKECEHVKALYMTYLYMYLVRLPMDYPNRNALIDDFFEKVQELEITELFERTSIEFSCNAMKNSQYAKNRDDWYSLYYIMK